jgi:hypothetical protein
MNIKNILKEGYTVAVLTVLTAFVAFVVVVYNAVINL